MSDGLADGIAGAVLEDLESEIFGGYLGGEGDLVGPPAPSLREKRQLNNRRNAQSSGDPEMCSPPTELWRESPRLWS